VIDVLHNFVGLMSKAHITTTLNTYSHVIPSLRGETASATEDVLGRKTTSLQGKVSATPWSTR
jgi:hypothetical protein